MKVGRIATWNIAGGLRSAQAPEQFSEKDQRAAVIGEILRWERAFGCDVLALQECEGAGAYAELLQAFDFVGSAAASETRGFVHLYAKRGVEVQRVEMDAAEPCVAMRCALCGDGGVAEARSVFVVALHLPAGDHSRAGQRQRIVQGAIVLARQHGYWHALGVYLQWVKRRGRSD